MTRHGKPGVEALLKRIRAYSLSFPGAREDHPWGESAFKVKGKIFCCVAEDDAGWRMSVKLEESHASALAKPFVSPTRYGLGKHGWITASFKAGQAAPLDLLKRWIEESFMVVAPLSVLKRLES